MLSFMTSFTMTTKWAIYGPQTNQVSGRIFTHNLGNSPMAKKCICILFAVRLPWGIILFVSLFQPLTALASAIKTSYTYRVLFVVFFEMGNFGTLLSTNLHVTPDVTKSSDTARIARIWGHYAFQGHSRSFKVIDFDTNRKPVCNFFLHVYCGVLSTFK